MPGPTTTDDSAFVTAAVLNELLRTLVARNVLSNEDIADTLRRTIDAMSGIGRRQAGRCVPIVEKMLVDLGPPPRDAGILRTASEGP